MGPTAAPFGGLACPLACKMQPEPEPPRGWACKWVTPAALDALRGQVIVRPLRR